MINIFVASIIFGIWSIILFFEKSIGLSILLFVAPFTIYIICKLEKKEKVVNRKAKFLMIPILLLSATYFIYNNKFFNIINVWLIIVLVAYMLYKLLNEDIKYNFSLITNTLKMYFKPFSFIETTFDKLANSFAERKKAKNKNDNTDRMKKIAKAIVITFPILLVVIVLLASADEVFGSIFANIEEWITKIILQIKIPELIGKVLLMALVSIYLLMFFTYIFDKYKMQKQELKKRKEPKDNFTIKVILGTLNVVYVVFCAIQIQSLFMKHVDINYAQYARQGFFQLMIVSIINLVMILIAKKSEKQDEKKSNIYINLMCIAMIIFTLIILVSSALRMYYYESAYGYTMLRLLVYCAIFTEAVLLIPTIAYILNIKINLSRVYLSVIITVYICMNFANFDAIIAKRNVDRYVEKGKIDIEYLTKKTSTDAIPEIIRLEQLGGLDRLDQRALTKYINKIKVKLNEKDMDFRDFNLSKYNAKKLLEELDNKNGIKSLDEKEIRDMLETKDIINTLERRDII